MSYIELKGVTKVFIKGKEKITIFQDFDFSVEQGNFLALMGPSGSGKSTLLNMIGTIDQPSFGDIFIDGEAVSRLSQAALATWRAHHVGFVFQSFNLIPVLTAAHNIELPLLLQPLNRVQRKQRVEEALRLVNLGNRGKHYPNELSGGQQQRVAIARAIATNPQLLLCDEPTGDLDRASADEVLEILRLLNKDHSRTVIMVTHDQEAAKYASLTLRLDKGRFIAGEGMRQ